MLDWIEENLIVPDGATAGDPLTFTREQAAFILWLYEVDPHFTGPPIAGRNLVNARVVRRAMLSRPKGWGKSPLVASLCLVEALGDVVLDGWDANGQPVGRSWASLGYKPKVQIVAVSEDQTANTWEPCLEMARNGPVGRNYLIEPLETFISVPRGRIEAVTSSGTSREGFRPVFTAMDQTESWTATNGGVKLAATVRRNTAKVQGCTVETPNAFEPGVGSVAEKSFAGFTLQAEGRTRLRSGLFVDHREAPPETDMTDEESLRRGLAVAYGDSADTAGGWVNLDRLIAEIWDPDTDPQEARRFYLNQITHASDSWLSAPEWNARRVDDRPVPGDAITLGFDGSRKRSDSVTDATALVACRVSDGLVWPVRVWEQPDGPEGKDWRVPTHEVDAAIAEAFDVYRVVAFYADPAKWEGFVAQWEAKYGAKLLVKATRQNPIEWWMSGGRSNLIVRALEQFHSAVVDGELRHTGSSVLARHVLNARRRVSRSGLQIAKAHPDSPNKIDAAVAAVLAWQARLDAVAAGVGPARKARAPRRLY